MCEFIAELAVFDYWRLLLSALFSSAEVNRKMGGVTESQELWFICSWYISCWHDFFPNCGLNDWHMCTCGWHISMRPLPCASCWGSTDRSEIDLIFQISQVGFQDPRVLFRILRLCQIALSLSILWQTLHQILLWIHFSIREENNFFFFFQFVPCLISPQHTATYFSLYV